MNRNVLFFVLGFMLILIASFGFSASESDFQVILGIGGLAALIGGIMNLK